SRAVKDPRGVLADFGVKLPANTEIRVWDSTAETRFLVLPMRPAGTEGWSEERLAQLVTRDAMIGTGLAKPPEEVACGTAFTTWEAWTASERPSPSRMSPRFMLRGKGACSRCNAPWAMPARGPSMRPASRRSAYRRRSI